MKNLHPFLFLTYFLFGRNIYQKMLIEMKCCRKVLVLWGNFLRSRLDFLVKTRRGETRTANNLVVKAPTQRKQGLYFPISHIKCCNCSAIDYSDHFLSVKILEVSNFTLMWNFKKFGNCWKYFFFVLENPTKMLHRAVSFPHICILLFLLESF